MALTKPNLLQQVAFDATKQQEIKFIVNGGSQITQNRLKIIDNSTGLEIYNEIQENYKSLHTISANKLKNKGYYQASVQTLDKDNNESPWSNNIQFYCYSTPTLSITNIPLTGIISNANFDFEAKYYQNEGEILNSYRFILYDSLGIEISTSGVKYANLETDLSYTFKGMDDNKSYKIEVTGITINGTSVTTGKNSFSVVYTQPTIFAILNLENNCEKGNIFVNSNIASIEGKSRPSPPIYIDKKKVDLREPDSYVMWDNGYILNNDFTLGIWGNEFAKRKDLCLLWSNDFMNRISISLNDNDDNTGVFAQLYVYKGDFIYYCFSNTIINLDSLDNLFIWVRRIDNVYEIKIEKKDGGV